MFLDLLLSGALVPLLEDEVGDDLGQAGHDLGEGLGRPVLLQNVQEPVEEMLLHFPREEWMLDEAN